MTELTQKQQYWQTHIEALSTFDGTAVEYAKLHDLDARKRYDYKSRMVRLQNPPPTSPVFLRAEPNTMESSPAVGVAVLLPEDLVVYLHREPVDFRKQINRLSVMVSEAMQLDPFKPVLYVFTNRGRNRIKVL